MSEALRKAVQLVLALHERSVAMGTPISDPLFVQHGWVVVLDPQAEQQLRAALAEAEAIDTVADIAILRALQHAANGLNYHQFCESLGWPEDDYTKGKFKAYQSLGAIGVFDNDTLLKPIAYYRGMVRA